jgi:hypothetical protein
LSFEIPFVLFDFGTLFFLLMNLVVCRRQSMPLVSSSTTSNYLDEIQMAEATQTRNFMNIMYCVVRVSARRLFPFLAGEKGLQCGSRCLNAERREEEEKTIATFRPVVL